MVCVNDALFSFRTIRLYCSSSKEIKKTLGDSVDCISGVPGVGPVKAKALLQNFQTIEEIYQNLEQVSLLELRGAKGLAKKLEEHRHLADLSKQLATIICAVTDDDEGFGSTHLEELKPGVPDQEKFTEFLELYNFRDSDKSRLQSLAASLNKG